MSERFRKCKIVCTIGPACDTQPMLEQMIRSGMNVARVNFSHGSHEAHARNIASVRAAAEATKVPVAILQDLCGPKIRCGRFPGGTLEVSEGESIDLVEADNDSTAAPGKLPIQYQGLAEDLREGDAILIDDGRVAVSVAQIADGRVTVTVSQAGRLRDRCGVHLPSSRVRLSCLTEKDKQDLAFGLSQGVDYVGLSFVRTAEDIRLVREITEAFGRLTPIVAKIETPSAIQNLEQIILATDAVMVARGDLGVEFNPERVPVIQREILGLARIHQRPVIVATEMLQSMVTQTRPTRAEASDVATAVFDGTDAVMLSQETATGDHPALVVHMMSRIITEAERSPFYKPISSPLTGMRSQVAESIAQSACAIADEVGARAIVAFTESGQTARFASKARPRIPIIAFSPNEGTRRRLALYWGVSCIAMPLHKDADSMVNAANSHLLAHGLASPGDRIVAMFGAPIGVPGTTNSIRVHTLE